jgi:hypothetical protein
MMKNSLIGFSIAALCGAAQAQFTCLPEELYGSGSTVRFATSGIAKGYGWTCLPLVAGGVRKGHTLIWTDTYVMSPECQSSFLTLPSVVLRGEVYGLAKIQQVMDACKTTYAEGSREAIDGKKVFDLLFPPVPTYAHWVRPNLSQPTRPYYRVGADGKRSLTIAGTVNVGTDCDPNKRKIVEAVSTYMAFGPAFDPNLVTVCVPK